MTEQSTMKTDYEEPMDLVPQGVAPVPKTYLMTPQTMEQAVNFATMLANSEMVPKDFRGNPGNILAAIQMGAEVGLTPMQALQNIAVINGRPCIWGDAPLALVKRSGLMEHIEETDDGNTATCRTLRKGDSVEVIRTFSMQDAEGAGLLNKDTPWRTYPKRMRQMRARAFALRDAYPDVLKGIGIKEEVGDYVIVEATSEAKDLMPRRRSEGASPNPTSQRADPPRKSQNEGPIEISDFQGSKYLWVKESAEIPGNHLLSMGFKQGKDGRFFKKNFSHADYDELLLMSKGGKA